MEKQLELKEAATKQKIQALRQQLMGASWGAEMGEGNLKEGSRERRNQERRDGDILRRNNYWQSVHTGESPGHVISHVITPGPSAFKQFVNPSKARSKDYAKTTASLFSDHMTPPASTSFSDHMTPPILASFADHMTPPTTASFADHMTPSNSASFDDHMTFPSSTSSSQRMTPPSTCTNSATPLPSSSNAYTAPSNGMSHMTPSNSHMTYNGHLTSTTSSSSHVMSSLSANGHAIFSPPSNAVMITTPNDRIMSNGHTTFPPTSSGDMTSPDDHMTSPSRHMTSLTSTPTGREKLTLPEEVKETVYMSAVQKQKVRVSRIRRCIVAATVIQRAWRDRETRERRES